MAGRQSARTSKITNDGLTRSGTGCFIAVGCPYGKLATVGVKGLKNLMLIRDTVQCSYLAYIYLTVRYDERKNTYALRT